MVKRVLSDADFRRLFEELGARGVARRLGMNARGVERRRLRIEHREGIIIRAPTYDGRGGFSARKELTEHPARLTANVPNGTVIVASDAHYWPGNPTTAHRGLIFLLKELKPALMIMNGDVIDASTISRHPPIGWEDRPTVIEEIECASDRLHEIAKAAGRARKIWPLGNHDCLDTATECLTKRGWKRHDEILQSDEILSLRPGGVAEWSPINEVVVFPYSGNLLCTERTRLSMAVTPNHRVLVRRMNWRSRRYDIEEYRHADDLPSSFDMPMSGLSQAVDYPIDDAKISLTGWLLTDGCYSQGITISQSKPAGIAAITSLLDRLSIPYTHSSRDRGITEICGTTLLKRPFPEHLFYILKDGVSSIKEWLPEKKMPAWANSLSDRQFQLLLDAIVAGNGVWDGYNPEGKTCAVVYGTKEALGDIQGIAVQHGWRARVTEDNRGDYRLCLTKIPHLRVGRNELQSRHYEGVVWCLRVPHGNFMVRRNGCAFFTGNSRFETRLAQVAPEYAKVHGVHLKDHFPLWEACWSVWINNSVVCKHRYKGGIHAGHNNALWGGKTMVTGHTHQLKVSPLPDYNGPRWGVETGSIADTYGRQFTDYTEDSPRLWQSGFAVLTFRNGVLLQPELVRVHDDRYIDFRGSLISV